MGKSRSVSFGSLLLSPESWWAHSFVCSLQESVSPVLCKFWQLYDGVNGDLLQEVLCLTHVCWTQSPVPVVVQGWPVPPQEMLRHSLAQSLWGLWVLVHTGFVWFPLVSLGVPGLILNLILALLPSCGFSFALGQGYFFFFFGWIQHYPVYSCSAAICNFGVHEVEDKCTSSTPPYSSTTGNPLQY